jgi:uncharacterized membrane protein YkvA (DUF1232 family)
LFLDKRVSLRAKALVLGALGYVALPLDFFPDWAAPVFAYADDFLVFAIALNLFLRMAPYDVLREHLLLIKWEQYTKRR